MRHSLGALCLAIVLALASQVVPAAESASTTVRVVDSEGRAVDAAEIEIQSSGGTTLGRGITDADGVAKLVHVPRGRHRVVVKRAERSGVAVILVDGSDAQVNATVDLAHNRGLSLQEEVTVSAEGGRAIAALEAPQATTIISKTDIDVRAKTQLAQMAVEEPGLYWQRTSPTVGAIFVRGLTGAKANLFLDGIRLSNAAARGGVNTFFNLVDPALVDEVEVTRGPSSAQYGSDAIGGSVQLFSKAPTLTATRSSLTGRASLAGGTADRSGGADASVQWSGPKFGIVASGSGRSVQDIRTGQGLDSHHAVTRFFGIPSTLVQRERLPGTSFDQYGGSLRAAAAVSDTARLVGTFMRGNIDGSQRYDQMLGGDGNLIAEIRDLQVDLASVRFEHAKPGFLDWLTLGYSYNSQYEERVNQGGNGNPSAAINHEPEKTHTNAFQARALKVAGRHSFAIGGDLSFEEIIAPSVAENATTGVTTPRRGRVPDGARYRSGGIYVQDSFDPSPRAHLVAALRASFAKYESSSATAPIVSGRPLWPNDSLSASALTFRVGASYELATGVRALAHVSRGFRAPHITDLATLGLTGAGFEASYDAIAPLGGLIGTTAGATAISTGRSVAVLGPEKSLSWEGGLSIQRGPIATRLSIFTNSIDGNIEKYAAILPQGSVGRLIGSEAITNQLPNGVVFVGLSANPVLVRANQENSRIWGIEHEARVRMGEALSLRTAATYLKAGLRDTGAPPNIEGGTPNPEASMAFRWTHNGFFVEPYARFAAEQKRLSTLDLDDRRTGASRSRASITAFFNNGARARGYVNAGADGRFGTVDDTLAVTGETLAQILTRVLGPSGATNSLYTSVAAYQVFGVRAGWTFAKRHHIAIDFENITDENYRGPSWGMDGAGRNLFARYSLTF